MAFKEHANTLSEILSDKGRFKAFILLRARSDAEIDYPGLFELYGKCNNLAEVRTYNGWKTVKRYVIGGEKGYPYADIASPYKNKLSYAFDISQTGGVPQPKFRLTTEQFNQIFDEMREFNEAYLGEELLYSKDEIAREMGVNIQKQKRENENEQIQRNVSEQSFREDRNEIRLDNRADNGDGRIQGSRRNQSVGEQLDFFGGLSEKGGSLWQNGGDLSTREQLSKVYEDAERSNALGKVGGDTRQGGSTQSGVSRELREAQNEGLLRTGNAPQDVRQYGRGTSVRANHQAVRGVNSIYARYQAAQREYPEAIVIMRMGDFYEVMGANAQKAADILDITLTSRDVGLSERIPMCGFPYHVAEQYTEKLLEKSGVVFVEADEEPNYIQQKPSEKLGQTQGEPRENLGFIEQDKTVEIPQAQKNYVMTEQDFAHRTPKIRCQDNINALQTLFAIEQGNRPATDEERATIAKYVGWGGLSEVFDESKESWVKERTALQALLSKKEYESARESVLNAHFTPKELIDGIYTGLARMGVKDAKALEPSCGAGNFIGCAPAEMNLQFDGVELEGLTARISKILYPQANIEHSGFEDIKVKKDTYDVVIGNVPFGNYKLYDEDYARENFVIHDYFIAKGLDELRPGGVMAVITSSGTLDKQDNRARKYFAQRAELLGAYRLPETAFQAHAGTETVTDILFFRKRETDASYDEIEATEWVNATAGSDGLGTLNKYFVSHPEQVLGTFERISGRFGAVRTVKASEGTQLGEVLQEAITHLPENIYEKPREKLGQTQGKPRENLGVPSDCKDFNYFLQDGRVYVKYGDKAEEPQSNRLKKELDGKMLSRIEMYIDLRDSVNELIQLQVENCSDEQLVSAQKKMEKKYDAFVKKHGYVSDLTNDNLLAEDNDYALVASLEDYDKESKSATKTAIFTERTISRPPKKTHTDNVYEAVDLSRNHLGYVDVRYIERLTGLTYNDVTEKLKGHIFQEISASELVDGTADEYSGWQTRGEYLSGNVVEKLENAQRALSVLKNGISEMASEEKSSLLTRLEENVTALESVQPKKLTCQEIKARLGATWIDAADYWSFAEHFINRRIYTNSDDGIQYSELNGKYYVHINPSYRHCEECRSIWGTERMNAIDIFDHAMNSSTPTVTDEFEGIDGKVKRVTNVAETAAAREKLRAMQEEFSKWLWENPARREKYEERYNRRFNNTVLPEYNGEHLSFNELNATIKLRDHQKAAVMRIASGGNVLLHHSVGAGKTYEMIAGALKLKEYGIANKPMFVVPNAIIGQWAKEIRTLSPTAKVLVTTKEEFEKNNRKKFISKIATGNWDIVLIAESQFSKIPVSPERMLSKLEAEKQYVENSLYERYERGLYQSGARVTVKMLKEAQKRIEKRVKELQDKISKRQDNLLTFEQLGVDYLFVDEAHAYKNKALITQMRNVAGLSTNGSERAFDMETKIEYLNELHGGEDKGVIFATGTPISNSMAEMYTMQSYLSKNALKKSGVQFFDAWANTFGETVTSLELKPSGGGVRPKTRFSRFVNLPELQLQYRTFADVKTADMLNLPVPAVERITETLPATEQILQFNDEIVERGARIERGGVEPWIDNMLKLTSDGKKLALDPRCFNKDAVDEEETKVNRCIKNVFTLYRETEKEKLTQVIFCDQSTPKGEEWSVYKDIKDKLVALGVKKEEIAFIHEADTDTKRAKLFEEMNAGSVRVLVGSTQKCGVGANFQKKLKALHHLDVPYRPADMEQREGRIIRQGNTNEKVQIFSYVTEKTFDSYSYQILENKQRFISQINKGDMSVREASDIDETTMSFAQIKAIATANPDFLRQMQLISEIKTLQMLKRKHVETTRSLQRKASIELPQRIAREEGTLNEITEDLKSFSQSVEIKLGNKVLDGASDEAAELFQAVFQSARDGQIIGSVNGMDIQVNRTRGFISASEDKVGFTIIGNSRYSCEAGLSAKGNITRISNLYEGIPRLKEKTEQQLTFLKEQLLVAQGQAEKPFEREEELSALNAELEEINSRLQVDKDEVTAEENSEEISSENSIKVGIDENERPKINQR